MFMEKMDKVSLDPEEAKESMIDKLVFWVTHLCTHEDDTIQFLKKAKFDMMIIEQFPDMAIIATAIEVPVIIKILTAAAEPIAIKAGGGAPPHSSETPMYKPLMFGLSELDGIFDISTSFTQRFKNWITMFLIDGPMDLYLKMKYWRSIPDNYKEFAYRPRIANLTLYLGAEGVSMPVAMPPNQRFLYPLVKDASVEPEFDRNKVLHLFI